MREKENSMGVSRREGEGFLDQEPLPQSQMEPYCVGKVGWKFIRHGVLSLASGCPFLDVSIISRKRGEARAKY